MYQKLIVFVQNPKVQFHLILFDANPNTHHKTHKRMHDQSKMVKLI